MHGKNHSKKQYVKLWHVAWALKDQISNVFQYNKWKLVQLSKFP